MRHCAETNLTVRRDAGIMQRCKKFDKMLCTLLEKVRLALIGERIKQDTSLSPDMPGSTYRAFVLFPHRSPDTIPQFSQETFIASTRTDELRDQVPYLRSADQ